jgi:predicted nucleic acid-binding protein
MTYLTDTSVLVRLADVGDPMHSTARNAIGELHRKGDVLHITAQNLVEFRNAATRPRSANGMGLTAPEADAHAAIFEASFPLLVETPDIFLAWKTLVAAAGVIGKRVHDARLVAVCHVHKVSHVLTFNVAHFAQMASFAPLIVVVDPATV